MEFQRRGMERTILHVDLDAFFVSVERLRDPTLNALPVVVGGRPPRGVVAAASYEARQFGIRSAMPMARAVTLCPELIVVRGHYELYSRASKAVFSVLADFTPLVEAVSIDEGYLDLTGTEGLHGPPLAAAQAIRARITTELRLPVSIGIGPTRVVAKIAGRFAKPEGVCFVPPGSARRFLQDLPVRALPGVGPRLEERLERMGFLKIDDLSRLGEMRALRLFGKYGPSLVRKARAESSAEVRRERAAPKSVGHERTLSADSEDPAHLEGLLYRLTRKVAARLRKGNLAARTLTVKLRDSRFSTHTRAVTLGAATDQDEDLFRAAQPLFQELFQRLRRIRLIGISASSLVSSSEQQQLPLFAGDPSKRGQLLTSGLDGLRGRYGVDVIFNSRDLAGGLTGGATEEPPSMGQENLWYPPEETSLDGPGSER